MVKCLKHKEMTCC